MSVGLLIITHAPFGKATLEAVDAGAVHSRCGYSGKAFLHEFDHLLLVTGRVSRAAPYAGLDIAATRIGDCLVPSSIADAVYSGHRFAREFEEAPENRVCRRERALLQTSSSFTPSLVQSVS